MISRQTASILSGIGLADFIAKDEESYVRMAVEWSRRVSLLAEMRGHLRQRFVASPVCDARKFTADLERIYREIWGKWCAERNAVASA
jgi:predicted O-linked N-acetylglucosamine transferase (SPINDLY family)